MKRYFNIFAITILWNAPLLSFLQQEQQWIQEYRQRFASQKDFEPEFSQSQSDTLFSLLSRWGYGPCYTVTAQGDTAFIGNGITVQAVDVSNPSLPKLLGEFQMGGVVYDIKVKGTIAYVASDGYFSVLNISDLNAISLLSTLKLFVHHLYVDGIIIYALSEYGTFRTVDVSDPNQPKVRDALSIGGEGPLSITAKDGYVYVGSIDLFNYLAVIDARNPDTLKIKHFDIRGWCSSSIIRDTLLYISVQDTLGPATLKIYNITQPFEPQYLTKISIAATDTYTVRLPTSMVISDSMLYAASMDSTLHSISIADPERPYNVSHNTFTRFSLLWNRQIAATSKAILCNYGLGVWIVDITQRDSLREQYFYPTSDVVRKIALNDSYAFVGAGLAGVWIVDITDPHKLKNIKNINFNTMAYDVAVKDSLLFVGSEDTIFSIDVSDPSNPKLLCSHHTTSSKQFSIDGDLLVGFNSNTFSIIDITNPIKLKSILTKSVNNFALQDVKLDKNIIFVGTFSDGLRIFKIFGNDSVSEITSIPSINKPFFSIDLHDSILVADRVDSLFIYNINNPFEPRLLGKVNEIHGSLGGSHILISNGFLYWTGDGSLVVYELAKYHNIHESFRINGSYSYGTAAIKNKFLLGNYDRGFSIIKNSLVTWISKLVHHETNLNINLYQNYPNPFNSSTTINFTVKQVDNILFKIYDIIGREVFSLEFGSLPIGHHKIQYSSKNLSSGTYFYLLRTSDGSIMKKMLIIQ